MKRSNSKPQKNLPPPQPGPSSNKNNQDKNRAQKQTGADDRAKTDQQPKKNDANLEALRAFFDSPAIKRWNTKVKPK